MVFTASHSCYANKVIDILDPNKNIFTHRLFREHCYSTQGIFIKDLNIFSGRDLKDIILIDNAAFSYWH